MSYALMSDARVYLLCDVEHFAGLIDGDVSLERRSLGEAKKVSCRVKLVQSRHGTVVILYPYICVTVAVGVNSHGSHAALQLKCLFNDTAGIKPASGAPGIIKVAA